jgi:hypothetical protein
MGYWRNNLYHHSFPVIWSVDVIAHTGRELDVEVCDREFAGDQAGEEEVAGFNQSMVLLGKLMLHLKNRVSNPSKLFDKVIAGIEQLVGVSLVSVEPRNRSYRYL